MENSDFWYMDDGPLSRLLCEAVEDNDDNQPEVVNPCCACDEAKYEVTNIKRLTNFITQVSAGGIRPRC